MEGQTTTRYQSINISIWRKSAKSKTQMLYTYKVIHKKTRFSTLFSFRDKNRLIDKVTWRQIKFYTVRKKLRTQSNSSSCMVKRTATSSNHTNACLAVGCPASDRGWPRANGWTTGMQIASLLFFFCSLSILGCAGLLAAVFKIRHHVSYCCPLASVLAKPSLTFHVIVPP